MWTYGSGSLAAGFLGFALQNIDYLLVGRLLGPVALGLYALAFRVAIFPFLTVTKAVAGVLFPLFSRVRSDRVEIRNIFRLAIRLGGAGTVLFGAGLAALAPHLVVLGNQWGPSVATARLLGVYVCLRAVVELAQALFMGTGRPGLVAVLNGVWVTVLGGGILAAHVRTITTVGALQVAVAAGMVTASVPFVLGTASIPLRAYLTDVVRPLAAGAVGVGVTILVGELKGIWANDGSIPSAIALGAVFAVIYGGALLVVDPRLPRDLRTIRQRSSVPFVEEG